MNHTFSRMLKDQDQVEHFLTDVLDLDQQQLDSLPYRIIAGEQGLKELDINSETLNATKFRDRSYKDDAVRWKLRRQIIDEFLTLLRLDNDEDICLGRGGALPQSGVVAGAQAFILIGLPASGKSAIAAKIAEKYGAVIIDPDFAKRKLPEYGKYVWGASLVHEESDQIVNGFVGNNNKNSVLSVSDIATSNTFNIVIPKIGQNASSIYKSCLALKMRGYTVHLTLVALLRKDATLRAIERFKSTNRYVPLGLIFDGYANDPSLSYFILKNQKQNEFASFGAISTNVPLGEPYVCIDILGDNPANLFEFKNNILI